LDSYIVALVEAEVPPEYGSSLGLGFEGDDIRERLAASNCPCAYVCAHIDKQIAFQEEFMSQSFFMRA